MSLKNVKELQKIAELLRQKLKVISKGPADPGEKTAAEATEQDIEINSDSEREALELFGNVNPPPPKKKQANSKGSKQVVKAVKESQNSLRSILRQQISMDEEHEDSPKAKPSKSIPKSDSESQGQQMQAEEAEMREQKAQERKGKSVSFNFEDNLIFSLNPDRKWNEKIQNQKKGKFQLHQQKLLSDAIGQYLATNEIKFQQFVKWLSVGSKEERHLLRKEKFFKLLASVLPNRSPMSCYKFVCRNYNSLNHQGEWTPQEVQKLTELVEKFGRKWTLIGKELGRTSDNVYDKYRSMGQEGLEERVKSLWKLRELVEMLLQIQRQTGLEFIDHNLKKELDKEGLHDGLEEKEIKEHHYNSKKFTFHNIELLRKYIDARVLQGIPMETIKWKKVVRKIPTKNLFDCRNKLVQILQVLFRNNETLDASLLAFLEREKATEECKLDWKRWRSQYAPEEARNRFMIMKKLVQGRTVKPFEQVYREIIAKLKKMQEKPIEQ